MDRRKLKSILLEIEYGKKLRESTKNERRRLVPEAYDAVVRLSWGEVETSTPEDRTAGTSRRLVKALIMLCNHDDRILEVGCGRGYTCLKIAPYVRSIVGIDASKSNTEETQDLLLKHNITNFQIYHTLADSLPKYFTPQSFDKIISIDVLEHLHPDDYLTHLSDAFEMLRPGGYYIAVGPNRLTGPHDVTRIVYPDATEPMGFHLNEFSYGDIVKDMLDIGFQNIRSPLPIWPLAPTICGKLLVSSKWFVYAENAFFSVKHNKERTGEKGKGRGRLDERPWFVSVLFRKTLFRLLGGVFVLAQKPCARI